MPFTNTEAAAYGVLAMYAMDMYRVQEDPLTPHLRRRRQIH
jgi:hypothetical protein